MPKDAPWVPVSKNEQLEARIAAIRHENVQGPFDEDEQSVHLAGKEKALADSDVAFFEELKRRIG